VHNEAVIERSKATKQSDMKCHSEHSKESQRIALRSLHWV